MNYQRQRTKAKKPTGPIVFDVGTRVRIGDAQYALTRPAQMDDTAITVVSVAEVMALHAMSWAARLRFVVTGKIL